ncbi:MAG: hypothetical protein M3619_06890 [Myxococcota bacterium]|nr:hypothetical protein [Myxococcota bacterium]
MRDPHEEPAMTRLDTIVFRLRHNRVRDAMFGAFVMLVAAVGATTVGAALHASMTIAQR